MRVRRSDLCVLSLCLAALVPVGGCDSGGEPNAPPMPPQAAGGPGGPGPGGPPGPGAGSPQIKTIMVKLNKGPSSLNSLIGQALKAEKPDWDTIQPQTKEYAQLASDMAKHEPAKGSKESWTKLTGEYADLANALDKAAQAKDKAAATGARGSGVIVHGMPPTAPGRPGRRHGRPARDGRSAIDGRTRASGPGTGGPPSGAPSRARRRSTQRTRRRRWQG